MQNRAKWRKSGNRLKRIAYWISSGADEGNRTSDLRVTSALLYQLSYIGIPARIISG